MKAIFVVMNTTWAVKKFRPIRDLNLLTHDLCDTGIAEVTGSNPARARIFFSGLIFTTTQVVFITAKVAFIFKEDIADHGSMQDACHMNFVIDLVHRKFPVAQW